MSRRRTVIVDRVVLRVPRGAARSSSAILHELGRVLGTSATLPQARLRVLTPSLPGDTAGKLADRVGRRATARLSTGGGDGG